VVPDVDRGRADQPPPLSSLWLASGKSALGDNVNITERLASMADPDEILISDASYAAARLNLENLEHGQLELKGKSESISVRVLHMGEDK